MLQLREGATPLGHAVGVDLEAIAQEWRQGLRERGRTLRTRPAARW
jgi:hypothetical protein